MKMNGDSKYFKTDCVFHEEILNKIEDSIEKNPDLSADEKYRIANILYEKFWHVTKKFAMDNNWQIIKL